VRVTLTARATRARTATASATGSFNVGFADVRIARCERFSVVAKGAASGRTAVLRRVPLPACSTG
jgi:hypothetical protein